MCMVVFMCQFVYISADALRPKDLLELKLGGCRLLMVPPKFWSSAKAANTLKWFSHFSSLLCVHLVTELLFLSELDTGAFKIMEFRVVKDS